MSPGVSSVKAATSQAACAAVRAASMRLLSHAACAWKPSSSSAAAHDKKPPNPTMSGAARKPLIHLPLGNAALSGCFRASTRMDIQLGMQYGVFQTAEKLMHYAWPTLPPPKMELSALLALVGSRSSRIMR